jgi:hypothetical protein
LEKKKMKTRRIGVVLLVCGIALSIIGFSEPYYIDTVLFPPSDPPIMRGLDSTEYFLVSNRSTFMVLGISGIMTASVGMSLVLWPRH